MSEPEFDINAAARYLAYSPAYLRLKVKSGEMPGEKIGHHWWFHHSELVKWLFNGDWQRVEAWRRRCSRRSD